MVLLCLLYSSANLLGQSKYNLDSLYSKEKIRVVITDSGLGGLSVMNDIAEKIRVAGCYREAELIFVNALFDVHTGYNSLQTREEKIVQLNSVLEGIEKYYHPDVIMIACNTLSVLYNETRFVGESQIPVIGIVEPGVRMIKEHLDEATTSSVIILGTETTIEEDSHRKSLLAMDIPGSRIVTKACPQLQSYIEQDPAGEETEMLIGIYLREALENLSPESGRVYISLNCSHFGYSEDLWKRAAANTEYSFGEILNPNTIMGDILIPECFKKNFSSPAISFMVVSKVELLNSGSMSGIFLGHSPELSLAIKNYLLVPDLF